MSDKESPSDKDQKPTDTENHDLIDKLKRKNDDLIKENQRYREKYIAYETKLEEQEKSRMEEQGKYKELAENYKSKLDEAMKEKDQIKASFGHTSVSSQVKLKAQELGCKDIDLLISYYKKDIHSLPVDDRFNVDTNHVKDFLEKAKKEKPLLFDKEAPKVNDLPPRGNQKEKPVNELKGKELDAEFMRVFSEN